MAPRKSSSSSTLMHVASTILTVFAVQAFAQTPSPSSAVSSSTTPQPTSSTEPNIIEDIRIECNSNDIKVKIETNARFNGLIYPKGLSRNSTCMTQYDNRLDPSVEYVIPLWSCNTMSTNMPDGGIEYFNTIVVQPHRKLVTSHGRGYHIRCKYQTQEKTVRSDFNVKQLEGTTPITGTAALPACRMLIYYGAGENEVAENVRIGDPLTLEIELDPQEIYGFKVTSCWVRDGMNQGEQRLIDEYGCPEDEEIMGPFVYESNKRVARVHFQAHKFPYTPSVYYTCNVKLCVKNAGGCDDVPPDCGRDFNSIQKRRRRRQLSKAELEEQRQRTIQVYSGLYVSEEEDFGSGVDPELVDVERVDEIGVEDGKLCLRRETFWWIIVVCGLVLMFAVLITTLILIQRRRRGKQTSTTGSSIYSGPYSNAGYSHSSS